MYPLKGYSRSTGQMRCFVMSPFRCAEGNGMRVESWDTFRTETQRGTEAAGQACLAQRGIHKKYQYLLYILGRFHIIRLRPEQRARRGTASQFPAQRGYPEEGRQCNGEALACASGKRLFCSRKAIVKRTKKEWYQRHDGGKRNAIGIQHERRI